MNRTRFHRRPVAARSLKRSGLWRVLLACLALVLAACGPMGASPIPQPPTSAIDVMNLSVAAPDPVAQDAIILLARPGTVPAGAEVRLTLLDTTDPSLVTIAAADGSFAIGLRADPGAEVRLEYLSHGRRSPPSDVVYTASDSGATWLASERFACIELEPGFALSLSEAAPSTLTLRSTCAGPVSIADPALRLGLSDFSVRTPLPAVLAEGGSQAVSVSFTRAAPGAREDVLFLNLTLGAQTIRYPVSLIAAP